jgi:hypothetical protein
MARAGAALRQVAHPDDHDLAQPAGKRRLPAHGIGMVEPALREGRRVEQHAINVDQSAASAGAKFFNEPGEFGMLLLLDQGHASHEGSSTVFLAESVKIDRG